MWILRNSAAIFPNSPDFRLMSCFPKCREAVNKKPNGLNKKIGHWAEQLNVRFRLFQLFERLIERRANGRADKSGSGDFSQSVYTYERGDKRRNT